MTKIFIGYRAQPGDSFDFEYYTNVHMPRSIKHLSAHPGFRSVSVERGLSGPDPGSEPEFVAVCEFGFESAEAFLAAFMPHAAELQGDMANYTGIVPVIQVSEVLISG